MKRILFLDVNGVLNSRDDCGLEGLGDSHLCELKRIVDEARCQIVLTSSWRLADDLTTKLRLAFKRHGVPVWIDSTPDLIDRAEEVQAWLRVNGPCVCVIVDDDCEGFGATGLRLVQTSVKHGLTAERATEVISAFDQ